LTVSVYSRRAGAGAGAGPEALATVAIIMPAMRALDSSTVSGGVLALAAK